MAVTSAQTGPHGPDLREPTGWRRTKDRVATSLMYLAFVLVIIPLGFVLFTVIAKGARAISWGFLTGNIPPNVLPLGTGGMGPAVVGTLLIGSSVFGIGCIFAALAPGYWWFSGALVVIGVAALMLTNTTNSMMQLSAEPAMRGRVMALRLAVALGGTPIGAPIVGWVANHFGPRWALGVGAASGFAAAIVAVRVLTRRTESMHESELRPI